MFEGRIKMAASTWIQTKLDWKRMWQVTVGKVRTTQRRVRKVDLLIQSCWPWWPHTFESPASGFYHLFGLPTTPCSSIHKTQLPTNWSGDAAPWTFKVASNSCLCFRYSLARNLEIFTVNSWIWFLRNYHLIEDHLIEFHFLYFECAVLTFL